MSKKSREKHRDRLFADSRYVNLPSEGTNPRSTASTDPSFRSIGPFHRFAPRRSSPSLKQPADVIGSDRVADPHRVRFSRELLLPLRVMSSSPGNPKTIPFRTSAGQGSGKARICAVLLCIRVSERCDDISTTGAAGRTGQRPRITRTFLLPRSCRS